MNRPTFEDGVNACLAADPRYPRDAYIAIRDALDHAQQLLVQSGARRIAGHLNGPELLAGFRDWSLRQFGPLARLVLGTWGITTTGDVGRVVFNLIEAGVFSKSDSDHPADFDDVFDFHEAFDEPFQPAGCAAGPDLE
jgi:uncharacterized repeat protein (TIGR04138 family)